VKYHGIVVLAVVRQMKQLTEGSGMSEGRVPSAPVSNFRALSRRPLYRDICRRREKTTAHRGVVEFIRNRAITFVQSRSFKGHNWEGGVTRRPPIPISFDSDRTLTSDSPARIRRLVT